MSFKDSIKRLSGFFRRTLGQDSAIGKKISAIDARHPRLFTILSLGALAVFVGGAAYIKFWAAPLSAGVDVPQFWAFAKVFQEHGLDFYAYADARGAEFPTQGWGYVYPPVWLLLLRIALFAAPDSLASFWSIDTDWRIAEKTPIIFADLAIGILLYWAIPGGRLKKLFFAFIWLFHPTAWYNSAVFGQFDAIAAALLLASVILLERGHDRWAFGIAALAVLTKQYVFIPVLMMAAVSLRNLGWRRLVQNAGIFAAVVAAFSIPFMITGNIREYIFAVVFPGQPPQYQTPLMYAFSGGGALLTYLHLYLGWDTQGLFKYFIPLLLTAVLLLVYYSYKKKISPSQAALAGILVFLCLNYRINYQYMVIFIPLALWVAAISKSWSERVFSIVMALAPMVWMWVFTTAFWFFYAKPWHMEVTPLMDRLGYFRIGAPEYAYVIIAMVLMGLFTAYIILAYTKWKSPGLMKFDGGGIVNSKH